MKARDEEYILVPFGQGFANMSTLTKEFYRLLMEGQIVHAGHAGEIIPFSLAKEIRSF